MSYLSTRQSALGEYHREDFRILAGGCGPSKLFFGTSSLDTSMRASSCFHSRASSPSAPLRRHNRKRSGVLMYLGLPHPAPSAFGFSQPLDGFFPHPTYLSYFVQVPPMGFKERWRQVIDNVVGVVFPKGHTPSSTVERRIAIASCDRSPVKSARMRSVSLISSSVTSQRRGAFDFWACKHTHRTNISLSLSVESRRPTDDINAFSGEALSVEA